MGLRSRQWPQRRVWPRASRWAAARTGLLVSRQLVGAVRQELDAFLEGQHPDDDTTFVALKLR